VKDRRFPKNTSRPLTEIRSVREDDREVPLQRAPARTQRRLTCGSRGRVHSRGCFSVGTWLSLVEHSLGVRGVGSSNLPVPTIEINHLQDYPACIPWPSLAHGCDLLMPTILQGCGNTSR
jgi:hypothetical protein